MSMICRKTMQPCQTEGMCAPWQGCADPKDAELRRLETREAALIAGMKQLAEEKAELLEALKRIEAENAELKDGLVKARQLIRELTNK